MAERENTSEEEYQFSDVESTDVFGTQQEEAFNQKSVMVRNIIIAVGVIAVILTVYKLLGTFFSAKQVKKISKPATQITKVEPVKTTLPAIQTQPQKPVITVSKTPSIDKKQLDTMKSDLESFVRAEAAANKTEIERLDNNINNIKIQLTDLNNKLDELGTTTKMLNAMIVKMKTPPKPHIKRRRKVVRGIPYPRRDVYYIQAIIPGRAWLKSKKGSTLTISVGTSLQGYGTVTSINPDQGKVLTSSGRTIGYNPDNR